MKKKNLNFLVSGCFEKNKHYFKISFQKPIKFDHNSSVKEITFELNKILGLILFLSISLLSPDLYPNFDGELFPITYVVFALFLTYILGINMYKKWKTSL